MLAKNQPKIVIRNMCRFVGKHLISKDLSTHISHGSLKKRGREAGSARGLPLARIRIKRDKTCGSGVESS